MISSDLYRPMRMAAALSWYLVKYTTAQSCVDAMMQHVGTFGTPRQILTDNGIQFVNELVAELLKS